jgi:SAM-dependent methyltransferase
MAPAPDGHICGAPIEIQVNTVVIHRLKDWMAHPQTRNLSIDCPETTRRRHEIIRSNGFLKRIYQSWYRVLAENIPFGDGRVVEVGSGAGFLKAVCPTAVTSEVFYSGGVDIVFNAMSMPFQAGSLRSLILVDVLHHIPDPAAFFSEAACCVRPGGRCLMIEPWHTGWSRWVYTHLHHEPFNPYGGWTIPDAGPLSGANGALPWILFERDRSTFIKRFPEWRISTISPMMPVVYLLSGGVSMRSVFPAWMYPLVRRLETALGWEKQAAMFASIILERTVV